MMNYFNCKVWFLVCLWMRNVSTLTTSTKNTAWSVAAVNSQIEMVASNVILSGLATLKLTYTTSASTKLIDCNLLLTDTNCIVDTGNCVKPAGYTVNCQKTSASLPLTVTLTIAMITTANDNNTVLDFPASGASNIIDWAYTPATIMALECPSTLTNAVAQLPSPCGFNCEGNFKCDDGYTGDFSGTCNAQAQWDATNTCTRIDCSMESIQHSCFPGSCCNSSESFINNTLLYNETLNVRCCPGYEPVSVSSVVSCIDINTVQNDLNCSIITTTTEIPTTLATSSSLNTTRTDLTLSTSELNTSSAMLTPSLSSAIELTTELKVTDPDSTSTMTTVTKDTNSPTQNLITKEVTTATSSTVTCNISCENCEYSDGTNFSQILMYNETKEVACSERFQGSPVMVNCSKQGSINVDINCVEVTCNISCKNCQYTDGTNLSHALKYNETKEVGCDGEFEQTSVMVKCSQPGPIAVDISCVPVTCNISCEHCQYSDGTNLTHTLNYNETKEVSCSKGYHGQPIMVNCFQQETITVDINCMPVTCNISCENCKYTGEDNFTQILKYNQTKEFSCSEGYNGQSVMVTCSQQETIAVDISCVPVVTNTGLAGWEIALIGVFTVIGVALCVIGAVALYKIFCQGPKPDPVNTGNGNRVHPVSPN